MPDTPARTAALLRLLEDWEDGRMTPRAYVSEQSRRFALFIYDVAHSGDEFTLTPAGLAAARAARLSSV